MTRNFEICDKNISNDDQNSLKISRFRRNLRRIIRAQRSTVGARLLVASESEMWLSSNPSLIFGGLLQIRLQSSLAPFFRHFAIRVQSGPADNESMNLALVRMIAGCGLSPSNNENHAFHQFVQQCQSCPRSTLPDSQALVHSKEANGTCLQLALDDTDTVRKRVVIQATTQGVAEICLQTGPRSTFQLLIFSRRPLLFSSPFSPPSYASSLSSLP